MPIKETTNKKKPTNNKLKDAINNKKYEDKERNHYVRLI
jgi:hypothetical protein